VVSNDFEIRGWKPAEVIRQASNGSAYTIYVYEVGKRK
jgi:hypothetical protein